MQQTVKKLQIIIVDSGSTDGTLAIAMRYPVKIVNIRPEEFSFGRSLNRGCAEAMERFIVIASAHVYPVFKDWIGQLLTAFDDPRVGLVYGKQLGGETTKFSEHQVFARWFPEKSVKAQEHPFCNNANVAIRSDLWEQFSYNEDLTGLEDLDWANRIMKVGHQIAYQSKAVVVHLHNEIYTQIHNRYRREAMAFKRIFPNEHFSIKDFMRLFVSNTISDYKRALRNGARSRDMYEIPLFRFMQFYGTYRGFKESGSITSQLKQTFYYPNSDKHEPFPTKMRPDEPLLINYKTGRRTYREDR
jgi:glycosyltransferase involved in cell wall biosynthesis